MPGTRRTTHSICGVSDANDDHGGRHGRRRNAEFAPPAREAGSAFVPYRDLAALDDILCEIHERTVGRDNCVRFEGLALQLPADRHRNVRGSSGLEPPVCGTMAVRSAEQMVRLRNEGDDEKGSRRQNGEDGWPAAASRHATSRPRVDFCCARATFRVSCR